MPGARPGIRLGCDVPAHSASKTRVNALVARASTSSAGRIKDVDGQAEPKAGPGHDA